MNTIECEVERSVRVRAPPERVASFLRDPERTGPLYPGMDRVERAGDRTYRFLVKEKSTLGNKFRGDYVLRYRDDGESTIRWETLSGNLQNTGAWKMRPDGDGVVVTLSIRTGVSVSAPKILLGAIRHFVTAEVASGVEAQLQAIRAAIERER